MCTDLHGGDPALFELGLPRCGEHKRPGPGAQLCRQQHAAQSDDGSPRTATSPMVQPKHLLARTAADACVILAEGMIAAAALNERVALIEEAAVNVWRGHEVREDHTLVELQHVGAAQVVDRRVSAVHRNLVH